ncbi:hypothetical protein RFI_08456 [Reticulomyxa filosa]|uniref:Uncharacterized protein n=1 Tax=Reticulomyxa filosa TaxID=46433 RepID=X6NQU4_RETFI|nr:hypothetical protein RFI_08456 [Reticulomyxa filosa]|eukprot:ETO28675.1 hypothetical protein RFI_08456 [Reticulomyxa filosa]
MNYLIFYTYLNLWRDLTQTHFELFDFRLKDNLILLQKKKKLRRTTQQHIGLILSERKRQSFKAFVGIDFGTYGTAFAYSFSDGRIYTEQKWPGHNRLAELKNKTSILLDDNGRFVAFGQEAIDKYFSSHDRSLELYENFKTALYGQTPNFYFLFNITLTGMQMGRYNDDEKRINLEPYLTSANGKNRRTLYVLVQVFEFMPRHIMKVLIAIYLWKKLKMCNM